MSRQPCTPQGQSACQSYAPGHQLHAIHAKHVGRTPWGWRDGVVVNVHGSDVSVQYLEQNHRLRVWHHRHLRELHVGDAVRVHERYYVLGGPFGWVNTVVSGGLGPVPEPEH